MFNLFYEQTIQFKRCHSMRFNGLTFVNSPRVHILITGCNGVIASNLNIIAPETSPNTDGINIAGSTNVNIRDTVIATGMLYFYLLFSYSHAYVGFFNPFFIILYNNRIGDDCIAITGGSSNIKISGIMCGPGHGIRYGFSHITFFYI